MWAIKKRWLVAGGVAATGALAYTTSDPFRQGIEFASHAARRGGTLGSAVGRCIWNYHRTLSRNYASESEYEEALVKCHKHCAVITREALEKNAGIYIKVGQHISALTYVLPEEWTTEMIPLQDRCPVSSFDSIKELFHTDEGHSITDLFSEFSPEPMGTASLAQVHRARLHSGQKVAVKVQHPSLARYVPLDVALIDAATRLIDYFFPQYPLRWLSDEMQKSIYVELDFREEARNAERTAEYFAKYEDLTHLRVPQVFWARQRILCMEFVTGIRADDVQALDKAGVDRGKLSAAVSHLFDNMIFTPGVGLHCDPHAGNVAVRALPKGDFEVVLYDHGLYRYVPTQIRQAYAHLWLALIDGDQPAMKHWAREFAGIDESQFHLFAAAITGRDFDTAVTNVVSRRSRSESAKMAKAVQSQGLLGDIMRLLSQVPNVVLLILKTNDLVRYLDEKLDSPLGVVRTFLIMAQYCARTVFNEDREELRARYGKSWSPTRIWLETTARCRYWYRVSQLWVYDFACWLGWTPA